MEIRAFQPDDEPSVVALWERCGLVRPWNDPHKDIARKLKVQPQFFLVGINDNSIAATVMAGYEGHRGWVNYLAVDPALRRRGFGRMLMNEIERLLLAVGCPKINLQVRGNNGDALAFYEALGYTQDDVVSMGKRLKSDRTNG